MTKPKYTYNGVLTSNEAGWASNLLNEYPHAVEFNQEQMNWKEFDTLTLEFPKYNVQHEDCQGQRYTKQSILFAKFSNFIFFKTKNEKKLFTMKFKDIIINENPFSTLF